MIVSEYYVWGMGAYAFAVTYIAMIKSDEAALLNRLLSASVDKIHEITGDYEQRILDDYERDHS